MKAYLDILLKYLARQRARFYLLAGLMLAGIGLQVANPLFIGYFIDAARAGKPTAVLTLAAVAFISFALVQQALGVSATYLGEYVAWVATNALREDMAAHCLRQDMTFHTDRTPGELIERIEGDMTEFSAFFSQLVIRILGNLLLLLGIMTVLFAKDIRLGLAFSVFAALTLAALVSVRRVAVPYQKAHRDAVTELFGYLEERLVGTEDIRSCGAVEFVLHGLYRLMTRILQRWQRASLMMVIVRATAGIMMTTGVGLAFVSDYYLVKSGAISLGTAYLLIYYAGLLGRPIRELTMQVESLQTIGATIERMHELLSQSPAIADGPGAEIPAGRPLGLDFRDVDFAYAAEKPVLRGLTFALEPGQVLGLLGRTGSGKTTIARLVFRLYDAQRGVIALAGTDIRTPTLEQLRRRVAYVTQDVQLFQASVRDNVTFFDHAIPDRRILEVIEALELAEWFRGLPHGLDTRLATGGRSLSAGEAQLLAFTRVFLRDPGLVILDEASSRLDPATEQLIERAIDHLLARRSAIIIAHRLGTLHRADDVLILEEGRAAEYGNRLALLADPGSRFAALHQTGLEEMLA